jgi:predicted transcriptional regulator
MTLRLTDEEDERLAELAVFEGRSKQDVVRSALADRWARQRKEESTNEAIARVLPRYQGLLAQLGSA